MRRDFICELCFAIIHMLSYPFIYRNEIGEGNYHILGFTVVAVAVIILLA